MICEKCPAFPFKRTYVGADGKKSAKYIIVGEGPGKLEVILKKPFVGDSGKVLWSALESMEFKKSDFYVTNVIKCMVKNPEESIVNSCSVDTFRELEELKNKKIILVLGSKAFGAFNLDPRGITYNSGLVFWSDRFDCAILPCIHPASTLYDKGKKELFDMSISFMLYARIIIETFGSLQVLSNVESKEIRKLKGMYAGQQLLEHRGDQVFEKKEEKNG